MSTKRACFHLLFIFVFVFNFVATVGPTRVAPASAMAPGGILAPMEDLVGWAHHVELNVRNNAATLLPAGYTTGYVLDTASLISGSQLKPDCSDLRVTYGTDPAESELDRLVEGCNTAATTVRFRTQADIPVGGNDHQYRLYYGNEAASAAPADPRNVYTFFDDFQDGDAAGWNAAKGTWGVVDDAGNFVYRYTSGGANWAISYPSVSNVANLEILGKMRAAASTTWIGLAFRIQDANNFLTFYESRDGSLMKYASVNDDNHEPVLATAASSMTTNTWYSLRVQAVGSLVRARFWQSGTAEPTAWLIQYTDTTFQTQSNFGATLYNHTTNADWDDIQVRKLVDAEPAVEVYVPTPPITDWYYRAPINVTNTSASATLPVKYTAELVLDTSALIDSGRMLATCEDLKVGSVQGTDVFEIDRVVDRCNSANTRVWFALQRPILPGANDAGYYLYYGDPAPQPPLANEVNVFIFYEDWEKGTSHWTNAGGLDPANTGTMGHSVISDLDWVSPLNSQQFPVKAAGGDAFSGYIPVAPNTTYTVGAWARSGENTYAPVGIDPYTAAHGRGNEQWLWTNEWTIGPTWSWRSAQFSTLADTAFIKIKSEWWGEAPGIQPVYMDNLFLRYTIASEPALSLGEEETTLVLPVIANILDDGPVNLGSPVTISADISTAEGDIDSATLRIVSPVSVDVSMDLVSGSNTDGTWQGNYTPLQSGVFSYRILAHATTGRQTSSPLHTFSVIDSTLPVITQLTFINPILVNNTQTVSVNVTDNGVVSSVSLTVGGAAHPMTQNGSQYSYSWQVSTVGDIPFTVTATDSAGNQSQLAGSFTSQAREVDVCTWKGCKPAAASWSNDDSNNACKDVVETAGFRGTYYVNGASPQQWYTDYSAAGHEIGAHTVGHPCNGACCGSTCTPETIWQCPYTETDVAAYRTDQFDPNVAAIETSTGVPVLSGAWPCGCTDAGRMTAAQFYFLGVRGYNDCGCNWVQDNNAPTPIMFMNLNGLHAYDQSFIDRAIADGTWTIITSHGSCDGISYMGSRQDVLWLPTVGEGLKYIKVRNAAQFSNYSRVGRTITFDAVHNLATITRQQYNGTALLPIAFDNPVSLKVHILDTDNVLSVLVNGVPAPYQIKTLDGTRYVVFDTPLDTTRHVVVNLTAPAPTIGQVTDNSPVELGGQAEVDAIVTVSEGTIESVNLEVLTPALATYEMTLVGGSTDTYTASFTPGAIGDYTYRVTAANEGGAISQSAVHTLHVQDTTSPAWRSQTQLFDRIPVGGANILSAEGQDIGGLGWATLSTNESGACQEFTWPVSDWWDHAWAHRVPVLLTESSGLSRSAETVDLLISSDQLTGLADCDAELRVAGTDRQEVPVQVYGESLQGGTITCHLLFQADLAASSSRTYYVYYGNPTASPPVYTTDLTSSQAGGLVTLHNSFFDLNLDEDGGVVSRLRLPQGTNTDLPLSSEANFYWGWHQVCSTAGGNNTGKNRLCAGGVDPASGLSLAATLDGPVVKEYTFTSVKGTVTYTIIYRFYANSPYYEYHLTPSGGSASVMNNFWYSNGYFTRLGTGTGGTPSTTFNTYSSGADQVRMATFTTVSVASIDGSDNDGTDLGGIEYLQPNAPDLDLWVTTGATQNDTEATLDRLAQPVAFALGALEDAPATQYGSPLDMHEATSWAPAAFTWQNATIPSSTHIQWRIKFCDLTDHCTSTDVMEFATNAAPTAHDDSYLTNEDIPLAIAAPGVLSNDSDPESNTLTAILVAGPAHGAVTLNPDGSFNYTPDLNYFGADSFTYKANDGTVDSNIATASITVDAVNDTPVAVDDGYVAFEDTLKVIPAPGVLGNDFDVDDLSLTAVLVTGPTHGTLSLSPDGSFTYSPAADYIGLDFFYYQVGDGELMSNAASVMFDIRPVEDAPIAENDTYSTDEDTPMNIGSPGVLGNDTDAENDPLSAVLVSSPSHRDLLLNGNGSLSYTPEADFHGPDSFTYLASDGELDSNIATASISVDAVNDAPVADAQSLTTPEDTLRSITLTGSDVDGDPLAFAVVDPPAHGTLSRTAPNLTYTPDLNYHGPDSFTFKVNDGTLDSNVATVSITVTPVDDPPAALDDSYTTGEDTALVVTAPGVLSNDSDPEAGGSAFQWDDTFANSSKISNQNSVTQISDSTGEFGASFTPSPGNPLATLESSGPWDAGGDVTKQIPGAVHADVQYFPDGIDGYKFWMIFTPAPETGSVPPGGYGSPDFWWERNTLLRSNDGINWVKTPGYTNPLVSPGAPGEWDDGWHADPDFVYAPDKGPNGEDWFLYYTGCGSGGCQIALALSSDGLHYSKYGAGPVSPAYRYPAVIYDSVTGTFHMWYNWGAFDVGYATSTDGIHWTPYNPVNPGQWGYLVYTAHPGTYDQGGVTHMDVIYFDGLYHMYYLALPTGAYSGLQIGHATSPDGMHWTQFPTAALVPGAETWNFWGRAAPAQVQSFYRPTLALVGDTLYMWYGGVDQYSAYPAPNYDIGLALSTRSVPDGHVELSRDVQSGEYPSRADTVAWYHMNEGQPAPVYPGEYTPVDPTLAWYHLNENTGGTAVDSGGTLNDVGALDGATWTTGLYGSGLSFDGNDRVTVLDSAELNPQDALTLEAWVNTSAAKANNYVMVKMTPSGSDYVYGMKIDNTDGGVNRVWAFIVSTGGTLYWSKSQTTVPGSAWTHLAMSYERDPASPTHIRIYMNGAEVAYLQQDPIPAGTQIRTSTGPLNIGVIPVGTPVYYQGFMDELRVVGRALTPEEIAADGSVNTPQVLDSSGNANHGAPQGGVTWVGGKFAGGLGFDGTGYVRAPHTSVMDLTDEVTIEAWVNPSVSKSNNYVVMKMTPGTTDHAYGLKLENQYAGYNEIGGFIQDAAGNLYFAYGGSVPMNEWTHIAMTYKMDPAAPTHIKLYKNGVEVSYRYGAHNEATDTIPAGGLARTNTGPLTVGQIPVSPAHYFNGILDEVRVLGQALMPLELLIDYGETYASYGGFTSELVSLPTGKSWGTFTASDVRPAGTGVVYSVLDEAGGVLRSPVVSGEDLSALGSQPLRLRAELITTDVSATPLVNWWSLAAEETVLSAYLVAGPAHGTLTLNPDGSFVYTPGLNYHGADSFTYKANDGTVDSNIAAVSITIDAVNDAPVADAKSLTTAEDTPRSITLTGSDVDGDPLAFTVVDPPTHGTLSGNAPDLLYTPEIDYHGSDSFTYKASDGELDSNVATVSITINPVNDAPVAVDDSEATPEDTALVVAADTLKINDTDVDNSNAELSVTAVSSPVNGVVTLEDGTITFMPDANFVGTAGFDYTVSDGFLTDSGHVTVAVGVANDAPVITGQDILSTPEDTSLILSLDDLTVTDPDNVYPDDFSLTVLGGSSYTVLDATVTPAADFNGTLTVPVFVNDGAADSNTFNLTVLVDAVNDAPVAAAQSVTTPEDAPLSITLTGSDADGDPLTFSVVDPPAHGTLSGTAPHLTYTPGLNYHGLDSFTYQANDGELDSNVAAVSITVDEVNDAPVADAQSVTTPEEAPLSITLTGSDVDEDPLTFTVVDPPTHGTLSGTAPHLTYTPSLNYHGPDSFTYKASDGTLDSNIATASLTVTPVDDPPVALDEGYTAGYATPLTVPAPGVLGNDTDVDSANLTALLVTGPAHGVLILNADGSFTYTPSAGYSGADSFTYTANDGSSASSPATVALTILPPDLIFKDGFESGGLGAWSGSVTDGGDLSVTDAAALVGSKGLLALVDDTQPVYVRDDSPSGESRYRARFYFDPNSIVMAPGDNHYILYAYSGSTEVIMLQLAFNGASYQLRGVVRNDASSWQFTPFSLLSDQPHFVEIEWRASSAPGASDGGLWLWLDGTAVGSRTGVDNDTRRIDTLRLGAVYGLDTGTHGSYSFDAFESRREAYIGP